METVRSCLGWQDFNRQTKAGMDIDNIRKSVRKKIANDYLTVTLSCKIVRQILTDEGFHVKIKQEGNQRRFHPTLTVFKQPSYCEYGGYFFLSLNT